MSPKNFSKIRKHYNSRKNKFSQDSYNNSSIELVWFKNFNWGIKLELGRTALLPADFEDSYTTTNIDGFDIKTSIL